jgi:hypothetical protein
VRSDALTTIDLEKDLAQHTQGPTGKINAAVTALSISLMAALPSSFASTAATRGIDASAYDQARLDWRRVDRPSKTPLGQRLRRLRQRIVDAGTPLSTLDEINEEVARTRSRREPR